MNRIAVWILSVAVAASGLCRPVLAQESIVPDEGRIVTLYVLARIIHEGEKHEGPCCV